MLGAFTEDDRATKTALNSDVAVANVKRYGPSIVVLDIEATREKAVSTAGIHAT